jgi:hypothetical protein
MNEMTSPSPDILIVPAEAQHIREIRDTLREGDRREIEAFGFSCAKGLWRSYRKGLMNRTALIDGRVAAIWGCGGSYLGSIGQPWLMTSQDVRKISPLLKFARIYQREVYRMLEMFPVLMNYVAADYIEAVRLLGIVGFTLGEPEKLGNGLYRKFEMRA